MKSRKARAGYLSAAIAAGVASFFGRSTHAAIIMDQIGTVPSFITGQNADTSDVFESSFAADDVAVVDDFTVSGPTLLTRVFAVTDGFGANFTSYSNVSGWGIEIYSSLAAASTSLAGDVYSRTFGPSAAAVNLTTPFGGNSSSALLNVSTAITLPAAGTYYLAVIADNSFTNNGEIGIYATTGVTGSAPGGLNAYQVNPKGGFGFANNENPLGLDAAYAISGVSVPEPTTAMTVAAAAGALGLSRRSRNRRTQIQA
jgi:hypothetical protein